MLSIIVPVYNAKKYLETCVQSILGQNIIDIEIILVDDGSNDGSGIICDTFSECDKRVKTIHKANGGVSSARNIGLDIASGEYIMFIDSDDWIEKDLCEKLLLYIENVDFVIGGYTVVNKTGKEKCIPDKEILEFPKQFELKFDELYKKNFINAPFSKIYKKNIIDTLRFDMSIALGEDFIFNLKYLSKCRKIGMVDTEGYIYNCMNEGAATKRLRESDIEQISFLYKRGKEFLQAYCPHAEKSIELKKRFCLNGVNIIQLICYSDKSKHEKKVLVKKLLNNKDFIEVCSKKYNLPFKYDFPRKLCLRKNRVALQIFFWGKEKISSMRGQ